jgi:hypothetical protein
LASDDRRRQWLQARDRNERIPDYALLKQSRDSGRRSRQHGADMAELRCRCCVEPSDLAITNSDPADRVSDLRNRLGHALHLFGEAITFGIACMKLERGSPNGSRR